MSAVLWSGSGRADRPSRAPARDRDADGIADRVDRCINRVGLPPDGCPPRDSDGDGVIDRVDVCHDMPGPAANLGCPDADSDNDSIADRTDRCRDVFGHPDFAGCPPPDRDGDGILDMRDRCVSRPETWNGSRDRDGCPDRGPALIRVQNGRISLTRDRVLRRSGKLARRGRKAVELAARALRAARAQKVRIAVVAEYGRSYGDSLTIATRRAEAIARELARHAGDVTVTLDPRGPDGRPRIELVYQ